MGGLGRLWVLAGPLGVWLAASRRSLVLAALGRVLRNSAASMLVAMAGMLDQLALGLLEPLCFTLARFLQWALGFIDIGEERLGARIAADPGRLGCCRLLLAPF
jgi:hypothetical protein